MLLVLDNYEHVLPAAPLVITLLAAGPHLTVLTTSRARLRLRGEREYAVSPLAVPAAGGPSRPPLAGLAGVASVRLFVERAAEVRPGFALTDETATAGRRDLSPPGRPAAGHRAGGGAGQDPAAGGAAGPAGAAVAPPVRRRARSPRAAADDARRHRLELRPVAGGRAGALPPPVRLRRWVHAGGGGVGCRSRGRLRMHSRNDRTADRMARNPQPATCNLRPRCLARRPEPAPRQRRIRRRAALRHAGDGARARLGTARSQRRARGRAPGTRRLLAWLWRNGQSRS